MEWTFDNDYNVKSRILSMFYNNNNDDTPVFSLETRETKFNYKIEGKYIHDPVEIFNNKLKIAIVGNSPDLLSKNLGNIIDEHDIVIRFNHCNNLLFDKKILGHKTDIRFSYIHSPSHYTDRIVNLAEKENSKLILLGYSNSEWDLLDTYLKNNSIKIILPTLDNLNEINNEYLNFAKNSNHNYSYNQYPTSGMIAILMMKKLYSNISLFGFSGKSFYKNSNQCYNEIQDIKDIQDFTDNGDEILSDWFRPPVHNMCLEQSIIKNIINNNDNINMY